MSKNGNQHKTKRKATHLPEYAIVPNFGKAKVKSYHGNGFFLVTLPSDVDMLAHRSDLKFINPKKGGKHHKPSKRAS